MTKPVLWTHRISVALIGVFVLTATVDGFAQSWAGLYAWAIEHGLTGWKAQAFPGLVDLFILVGELGLFVLALEAHKLAGKLAWFDLAVPGVAALAGWSVSLAFNVGHVAQDLTVQLTAAVPPIASMLGLLVLLRTLHRFVMRSAEPGETLPEPVALAPAQEADLTTVYAMLADDIGPAQALQEVVTAATRLAAEAKVKQEDIAGVLGSSRHHVRKLIKSPAATEPRHEHDAACQGCDEWALHAPTWTPGDGGQINGAGRSLLGAGT